MSRNVEKGALSHILMFLNVYENNRLYVFVPQLTKNKVTKTFFKKNEKVLLFAECEYIFKTCISK